MTSSMLHRLAVIALTLVVALPVAPRDLVVLCLGADGHVAFESASDICREEVDVDRSEGDAFCSDVCGPCTDVQLTDGAEASGRPSNHLSALEPLSPAATPAWSASPAPEDFTGAAFERLRLPAEHGISSRSLVALLI